MPFTLPRASVLALTWVVPLCLALPPALPGTPNTTLAPTIPAMSALMPRGLPAGLKLTVLCVGDSITVGVDDGYAAGYNNGYRLDLYNMLTAGGIDAQFIGSQVSGTDNPQPHMEGYGWRTIDTILDFMQADGILSQQPNLILLHAGTNDNDLPQTSDDPTILFADAPTRLGDMIDYILCQDPNAVVLVAKLIQNNYNQEQTNAFNEQVPLVVGERYMKGYKIRVVDMSMIGGDELADQLLHPTAAGYLDMANRWYSAILGIPTEWWTSQGAIGSAYGGSLETCDRKSISFSPAIAGNVVNPGFHVSGDTPEPLAPPENQWSTFQPGWGDDGVIAIGSGYPGSGVIFADINGDGRPDYIWANLSTGSAGAIYAWLNPAPDTWVPVNNGGEIAWGEAGTSYVELADLDGDKRAEYILIVDGAFRIWQNGGPIGQVWSWTNLPNAENELNYIFGNNAPFHYFADINGDGRADLIVVNDDQVLDFYFNDGSDGNGGFTWSLCRARGIATGQMFFVDVDGDGRADYVTMDSDGGLSGWINNYGGGCNLTWTPINGRTPKSLALGTGAPPAEVRLADFTGDGKADYLVVDSTNGAVHLYPNLGSAHPPESPRIGGYAAAVRLADINGDGIDDYVSITELTGLAFQANEGQVGSTSWDWALHANGSVIALGYSGATRSEIHLADMNGDGREDYLVIDDATGAIHCYLNLGPSVDTVWNWDIMGEIAIGVGGVGAGVRIADFDGDGRADYIYMDESSAATVWLNKGPGDVLYNWQVMNGGAVAALGVGANRDNVQFADIDGDGKADYCLIDPETGALSVWYNLWDGTTVGWSSGGTVQTGQGYPGPNIQLGRIGNSGRYDYVALEEDTGALRVWLNDCADVVSTITRLNAGSCGQPPMPTRPTTESFAPTPSIVSIAFGGLTVLQGPDGAQETLPPGLTSPTTMTDADGETFTYIPGGNTRGTTFTETNGATVVQDSLGVQTTLPTGITAPVTLTQTDGNQQTYYPSSASSSTTTSAVAGFIFPITTPVPSAQATDGVLKIPCDLWFFNLCIEFGNIDIDGWEFPFPTGLRPPGPPPAITFPPSLSISVSISGKLPEWPSITIGPDSLPTYQSKPTDGPDDQCNTQTAEVCLTSTSFGVNANTVTTTSSVTATCATLYGCSVSESASSTTYASTSTSEYPYSCTPGCAACGNARRDLRQFAAETRAPMVFANHSKHGPIDRRDIPYYNPTAGFGKLYQDVINSEDTYKVALDTSTAIIPRGISSSQYQAFEDFEINMLVQGLTGCTSVVVVSRLGVWMSHLWESSFQINPADPQVFQREVLDYFHEGTVAPVVKKAQCPSPHSVQSGVFDNTDTTRIFIMTPATYALDLKPNTPQADQSASITDGNFQPLFDGTQSAGQDIVPDRIGLITQALEEMLPNVIPSSFVYRRQTNDEPEDENIEDLPYGRAMVLYSNNQVVDPTNDQVKLGGDPKAVWQCWMQGALMGSDLWDALPSQVYTYGPAGTTATAATGTGQGTVTTTAPFPTLSSTGISSISGSSCVATGTQTDCAEGPGGQTACATSLYCASYSPTPATTTAVPTGTTIYQQVFSDTGCTNQVDLNEFQYSSGFSKCFIELFDVRAVKVWNLPDGCVMFYYSGSDCNENNVVLDELGSSENGVCAVPPGGNTGWNSYQITC